jgi:hypothetical protein
MEQAQFGVLEMDWFIASLQPMRWIKVPGGRSRARRGRTLPTRHNCVEPRFFGQTIIQEAAYGHETRNQKD